MNEPQNGASTESSTLKSFHLLVEYAPKEDEYKQGKVK